MPFYKQKSSFEAAELDGEWVILNTEQYTVTKLNQVGGYCWNLLKEHQTVESLAEAVAENFSAEVSEINRDIEDFLTRLLQFELIQYAD